MDIASTGALSSAPMTMTGASRMGGSGSEARMSGAISTAASLFGMTASDLAAQLNKGTSMTSIAAAKGISATDLTDAIKKGIQASTSQGAPGPSGALLDKIASRIANHTGGHVSGHHHRTDSAPSAPVSPPAPGSTVTTWL